MKPRDERIFEEAAELWRQLYREPPPAGADGGAMLDMILRGLPPESYGRLMTPHLRPATIVFPE